MFVFVYGTLKKGLGNHYLLGDSEFIGEAVLHGASLYSYCSSFPSVSLEVDGIVKGEVYRIDEDTLYALDGLEGFPIFYNRSRVNVTLSEDLTNVKAWVYHIDDYQDDDKRIEKGYWG